MIAPAPPAAATAPLLSTSAIPPPRLQSTILPATLAGSSTVGAQNSTRDALAPASPAAVESIRGLDPSALAYDAPAWIAALPSVTEPSPLRLCVPAATVVTHGPGCATAESNPALPADVATNTPASAANRKATSTGSRKLVWDPLTEKLMTSTPSATAWSMAATLSELKQPPPRG